MMQRVKCGDCVYLEARDAEPGMGYCRRYPPQVYLISTEKNRGHITGSSFPYVNLEFGWCGEGMKSSILRASQ